MDTTESPTLNADTIAPEAQAASSLSMMQIVMAIAAVIGIVLAVNFLRGRAKPNEGVLETVSSIDEGTPDASST